MTRGQWIEYLPEELAWIEARKDWPRAKLHAAFVSRFGRYDVTLIHIASLCKRKRWLTGRNGQWQKGQVSHNKGKPMPFHPNSAATRFKKGNVPPTRRGAGHECIDGREGYVWMIVNERNPYTGASTRRVQKHKWLWQQVNGPVPEGHALKCLDGDKTNTDPSNWVAIPRAMLPRLNGRCGRGYDSAPTELKPLIMATTRLEHTARERRKAKREAAT